MKRRAFSAWEKKKARMGINANGDVLEAPVVETGAGKVAEAGATSGIEATEKKDETVFRVRG